MKHTQQHTASKRMNHKFYKPHAMLCEADTFAESRIFNYYTTVPNKADTHTNIHVYPCVLKSQFIQLVVSRLIWTFKKKIECSTSKSEKSDYMNDFI